MQQIKLEKINICSFILTIVEIFGFSHMRYGTFIQLYVLYTKTHVLS